MCTRTLAVHSSRCIYLNFFVFFLSFSSFLFHSCVFFFKVSLCSFRLNNFQLFFGWIRCAHYGSCIILFFYHKRNYLTVNRILFCVCVEVEELRPVFCCCYSSESILLVFLLFLLSRFKPIIRFISFEIEIKSRRRNFRKKKNNIQGEIKIKNRILYIIITCCCCLICVAFLLLLFLCSEMRHYHFSVLTHWTENEGNIKKKHTQKKERKLIIVVVVVIEMTAKKNEIN